MICPTPQSYLSAGAALSHPKSLFGPEVSTKGNPGKKNPYYWEVAPGSVPSLYYGLVK